MSEGITYNPNGTVTVTFNDDTYHLRRPTFGQFRYFNRKFYGVADELRAKLAEAQTLATDDTASEADKEKARELIKWIGDNPLHEHTAPILADMFTQVGDPLPESVDDWPAWLVTDPGLMREILDHWRTVPKASGTAKEANGSG